MWEKRWHELSSNNLCSVHQEKTAEQPNFSLNERHNDFFGAWNNTGVTLDRIFNWRSILSMTIWKESLSLWHVAQYAAIYREYLLKNSLAVCNNHHNHVCKIVVWWSKEQRRVVQAKPEIMHRPTAAIDFLLEISPLHKHKETFRLHNITTNFTETF